MKKMQNRMENIHLGETWDEERCQQVNAAPAQSRFWTLHKKPENGYLLGSTMDAGEQTYFSSSFSFALFVFLKIHYYFIINSSVKIILNYEDCSPFPEQ